MQTKLAKKLKELRSAHNNTQEELAKFLSISVQAVSKWERAEGMPDITLLPQIAGFYAVSVDSLLGVDETTKEMRIREICKEYDRIRQQPPREDGTLIVEHNIEAGIEHIRNALKELPDCWFFMQLLASDLWYYAKSKDGEEKAQFLDEAEGWCRKLLKNSPPDCQWRHCANEILCLVLYEEGNKQQAVELAQSMPDAIGSNDYMLTNILEGTDLERQLNISTREFIRLAYLCAKKMKENNFDKHQLQNQHAIKHQLDFIASYICNE